MIREGAKAESAGAFHEQRLVSLCQRLAPRCPRGEESFLKCGDSRSQINRIIINDHYFYCLILFLFLLRIDCN